VAREHATGDVAARWFAIGGGLIFVSSLVYTAWSYAWTFGFTMSGSTSLARPVTIDTLLFSGFALHHSVFARSRARQWIADRISPRLERSVYVWVASLLLAAIVALWQPVPGELWRVTGPAALAFNVVQIAGVLVALRASAALDVLSLAGVRQAFGNTVPGPAHLVDTGLYGVVRHPVYFGWVLMVWPTSAMTGTRVVFAAVSTIYLALAIPIEERSLTMQFGAGYRDYVARVRWRMVPGIY
jgi:protein-S-isoprenylcysteine O-methyltransferase Ste14